MQDIKSSLLTQKYNTSGLNKEGNTYDEIMADKDCKNLVRSVGNKFLPYLDVDDISHLTSMGILDTCRKYKTSFNVKFTTFLMQQVFFKLNSFFYKSKKKYLKSKEYRIQFARSHSSSNTYKSVYTDVMESVSDDDRAFIEDRFIQNLSVKEMSKKYDMKDSCVRKRCKNIIGQIQIESGVSLNRK